MTSSSDRKHSTDQRINHDIKMRCLPGMIIYIIIWPVVVITTDYYPSNPQGSIAFALALCIVSILRILHLVITKETCDKRPSYWLKVFAFWTLLQASVWSLLFALCLLDERFQGVSISVLLVTAGLVTGSGSNLAPSRWLSISYLSVILLPNVIFSYISESYSELTVILIAFWAYSIASTSRLYQEYHLLLSKEYALEQINITDSVTKIYNRRFFDKSLLTEWKHSIRKPSEISLLLVDIDHFKQVNDNYGHQIGDLCLEKTAEILKSTAKRHTDIVARYGGEEFAIITPHTDKFGAITLAERMRDLVEQNPIVFDDNRIHVTVSIGVSTIKPDENIKPEDLIKQADSALYSAKARGRNCAISFEYVEPLEV